jgi:hypothetical protein
MAKKATKTRKTTPTTKSRHIVTLLSRPNGASLPELMKATGWQAHSIRGFLSGALRKKQGIPVGSAVVEGTRRYLIARAEAAS